MTDMVQVPRSTLKELVEMATSSLVFDGVGVYPASNNGTPRTEKQDGWNEAIEAILKRSIKLNEYFDKMDIEKVLAIVSLIYNGSLFLFAKEDGEPTFAINCNDLFAPAADYEDISYDDLEEVSELHKTYGFAGVAAFAAMRRKGVKLFRCSSTFTKDFEAAVEALRAKELFEKVHPKIRDDSKTIVATSNPSGKNVWYELFKGFVAVSKNLRECMQS